MSVFQILLLLEWEGALSLENMSNSSIVIVLYFSVTPPFLSLCLPNSCLAKLNVWIPFGSNITVTLYYN